MYEKKISLILAIALLFTFVPNIDSKAEYNFNNSSNIKLLNSETIIVNYEGKQVRILAEEYGEVESDISTRSLYPQYKVGTRKTWVFKISNTQLGLPKLATGAPISAITKAKLAKLISKAIGKKIGSAIVPIVGWTTWILAGIGAINQAKGNEGFKITINGVYKSTYYNKGGYYNYAWSLSRPKISTY